MKSILRVFILAAAFLCANTESNAQCTTNFSYSIGSGGVVTFTAGTSWNTNTTHFYWSFGNNTYTSGINMTIASTTYTTNNIYTVSLWATDSLNSNCNAWTTQTVVITGMGCNDSLSIGYYNGPSGLMNFYPVIGSTGNLTNVSWSFGDGGTQNSGGGPAAHTYTAGGLYTVTLSVTQGLCTYTAATTVSVNMAPCNLNASFTYTLGANGSATFASTSTGAGSNAAYYWYFGDGNNGYGQTVTHNYNASQQYGVILTVNDSTSFFCTDSTFQNVNITNGPCANNSSFWVAKDSTQNLTWNAYPTFPGNVVSVLWSWGDGGTSNSFYPSHTYSAAGFYTICVSTTLSCGTSTTFCWAGNVYRPSSGGGVNSVVTLNVVNPHSPVAIREATQDIDISFYPNPAADQIFVELEAVPVNTALQFVLTDLLGKEISNYQVTAVEENSSFSISTGELPEGLYYLQIKGETIYQTHQLIVKR